MPEHPLTETIRHAAADLADAPLEPAEVARLAPALAALLTAIRALDAIGLDDAEPAFADE
jgi:hypothetical protein